MLRWGHESVPLPDGEITRTDDNVLRVRDRSRWPARGVSRRGLLDLDVRAQMLEQRERRGQTFWRFF
jgi:hypothetical protein